MGMTSFLLFYKPIQRLMNAALSRKTDFLSSGHQISWYERSVALFFIDLVYVTTTF
tara:strand:+ start:305 stop:472 length:168 start_codon:yes stop_codon:yes gene_type:complete